MGFIKWLKNLFVEEVTEEAPKPQKVSTSNEISQVQLETQKQEEDLKKLKRLEDVVTNTESIASTKDLSKGVITDGSDLKNPFTGE